MVCRDSRRRTAAWPTTKDTVHGREEMLTKTRVTVALAATGLLASVASAQVLHGVSGSTTVLHGGDRELTSLTFAGASNSMTGADFARFGDGSMTTYISGNVSGPYGWTDAIPRDVSTSGNKISGNPDRADGSTPYLGEPNKKGTLSEVFGTSRLGYKNMSWIIDGEAGESKERYTIDLLFTAGFTVTPDNDPNTIELAFLERGQNSDVKITGLHADRSTTTPLFISRQSMTYAGWKLDTLEIDDKQLVAGVGVSLTEEWSNLVGLRIEQFPGYDGTDIVGIGVLNTIPAPGPLAISGLGALILLRRRRS